MKFSSKHKSQEPVCTKTHLRMEAKTHNKKNKSYFSRRHNKVNSKKIVDKITYNPAKHKQKLTRKSRLILQQKIIPTPKPITPTQTIKFGSFNMNGLDLEAAWAVGELLKNRGFDVSYKPQILKIKPPLLRFLHCRKLSQGLTNHLISPHMMGTPPGTVRDLGQTRGVVASLSCTGSPLWPTNGPRLSHQTSSTFPMRGNGCSSLARRKSVPSSTATLHVRAPTMTPSLSGMKTSST